MMLDEVRAAFPTFTDRFEGKVGWMYLDILGLVTTGRGNLIDPITAALALPWKQAFTGNFGALATTDQVTAEWTLVKSLQIGRQHGGGWFASQTRLRLAPEDIDALTFEKLDQMWAHLLGRFADLESWPATAQLGLVSMSWAMGPAFVFPHFQAAALAEDWDKCATECQMNATGNPGLVPRNDIDRRLFLAARDGVALVDVLHPNEAA